MLALVLVSAGGSECGRHDLIMNVCGVTSWLPHTPGGYPTHLEFHLLVELQVVAYCGESPGQLPARGQRPPWHQEVVSFMVSFIRELADLLPGYGITLRNTSPPNFPLLAHTQR